MDSKALVKAFFSSNYFEDKTIFETYLHEDFELHWNNTQGFIKLDKEDFKTMLIEVLQSFTSLEYSLTHLIAEDDKVCMRYTYYFKTIEQPDEVQILGHFMALWEIKDSKLYRCYQISQPSSDSKENMESYIPETK